MPLNDDYSFTKLDKEKQGEDFRETERKNEKGKKRTANLKAHFFKLSWRLQSSAFLRL